MPERDLSRYARQTILPEIGREGQERLLASRVVVVGCGALGSMAANLLARAGVGHLRLIDRDFVELNNLQRQVLYDEGDVEEGMPKAAVAEARLRRINSDINVEGIVADINAGNALSLLEDADVIVDAVDNFEARMLINDAAVSLGKPWIYGAVIGSYGLTMNIIPGETPCLTCLFQSPPEAGEAETCATAGILGPIAAVISALQTAEALRIAMGRPDVRRGLLQVDVWDGQMDITQPTRRPDCRTCVRHEYVHLMAESASQTVSLCGQDAVQIVPPDGARVDLADLAQALAASAQTRLNPFMLRILADGYEINVFADGRAIVKGTTDPTVARALYSKYVGM